jgi:hypothetical protein
MKTKESIAKYNIEYFARPEVIAKAKIRNSKYKLRRKLYKKTIKGKNNENKYRRKRYGKVGFSLHLKERYKITLEQYNEILNNQKSLCAICGCSQSAKLHVDHCHSIGKVRGLLCGSCNRALGLMKDNIDFLNKAIIYLQNV